jgi:hypothetical protein
LIFSALGMQELNESIDCKASNIKNKLFIVWTIKNAI